MAACTATGERSRPKGGPESSNASVIDDGRIVAEYLAVLDRLGRGGMTEQSEVLETMRTAYLADPSTRNRLGYAFVLAVPGHAATDSVGARRLLGEVLATPETMLQSERALAELMARELDARMTLTQENARLRADTTVENDRVTSLNKRLQQETAEKERLRRELEEAQAKLEAIATLEGGGNERKP
jgi:cell division septum initiation protein DivIVA